VFSNQKGRPTLIPSDVEYIHEFFSSPRFYYFWVSRAIPNGSEKIGFNGKLCNHSSVVSQKGSNDMAAIGWSNTGAAKPQGFKIAMAVIGIEKKLETLPDPAKAFDWSFVQR
jgi:hypothetical protein